MNLYLLKHSLNFHVKVSRAWKMESFVSVSLLFFQGKLYVSFAENSILRMVLIWPSLYTGCAVLSRSVMSDSLQPHGLWPTRLFCPWGLLGKNTEVRCHSLLQGIFPIQGSKPGLLHCRQNLSHLSHQGSSRTLEWVAYPFSRGTSWPRNRTGVSSIADGFFTNWTTQRAHILVMLAQKFIFMETFC